MQNWAVSSLLVMTAVTEMTLANICTRVLIRLKVVVVIAPTHVTTSTVRIMQFETFFTEVSTMLDFPKSRHIFAHKPMWGTEAGQWPVTNF